MVLNWKLFSFCIIVKCMISQVLANASNRLMINCAYFKKCFFSYALKNCWIKNYSFNKAGHRWADYNIAISYDLHGEKETDKSVMIGVTLAGQYYRGTGVISGSEVLFLRSKHNIASRVHACAPRDCMYTIFLYGYNHLFYCLWGTAISL